MHRIDVHPLLQSSNGNSFSFSLTFCVPKNNNKKSNHQQEGHLFQTHDISLLFSTLFFLLSILPTLLSLFFFFIENHDILSVNSIRREYKIVGFPFFI